MPQPADFRCCERVGGFFGQKLERRNLKREAAVSEEGQQAPPLFSSSTWVLNSLSQWLELEATLAVLLNPPAMPDYRWSNIYRMKGSRRRIPMEPVESLESRPPAPQRSSDKSRPHNQLKN